MHTIIGRVLIGIACLAVMSFGCGFGPGVVPDDGAADYLGIYLDRFGASSPLDTQANAIISESAVVALPVDLLVSAPEQAAFVLSVPDVAVTFNDATTARAASDGYHATVTFRLAPLGEDACASNNLIGPFDLIIGEDAVTVDTEALPLSHETRAAILNGNIEMCAETWADFDGAISLGKVSIEFGELPPDEKKVELCHIPPGNPSNRHNISVGRGAVDAHLEHGDYLGACRDLILDLEVAGVCADEPAVQRRWKLHNPNDFNVVVNWELAGTEQAGQAGVPPGDYYLLTDTVDGDNTLQITWRNEGGMDRSASADSVAETCAPDTDADADGVADEVDVCPATPADETVDSDGCSCSQLDSDADGVDDCLDLCADTPEADAVDADGCGCSQRDSDGDGIDDCDDACAQTPADAAVDVSGCPVADEEDEDNDGVANDLDLCPGTIMGRTVDADGCSCSQKDEDGDGVDDCDDMCPGTAGNVDVDADGCEVMTANAGSDLTLSEVGPVTLQGSCSGGTPPYRYAWSADGWAGSNLQNPTVVPAQTTTYTLTVTDWSLPPQTATATVTVTIEPLSGLSYTIRNLGSPSGNSSYGVSLNDGGQVAGYYFDANWKQRAFRYTAGTMTDLDTLGGASASARDINTQGQVVGESTDASGNLRAFAWDAVNGIRDLGTLGGATATAYAINDSGQVVGYSSDGVENHAFLYDGTSMTALDITDFYMTAALDINNGGTIVGTLLPATGDARAFVYDDGVLTDLGSPLLSGSQAWAINDAGAVTGYSWEGASYASWLYAGETTIAVGQPTGYRDVFMWGINNHGRMVGSMTDAQTGQSRAVLYAGGRIHLLLDLLAPGHGWDSLNMANDINTSGQITGYGYINGQQRAFLLTPLQP